VEAIGSRASFFLSPSQFFFLLFYRKKSLKSSILVGFADYDSGFRRGKQNEIDFLSS